MTTQNWPQLNTISPAYQLIKERGLAKHLEELQAYGLTVIPPEKNRRSHHSRARPGSDPQTYRGPNGRQT